MSTLSRWSGRSDFERAVVGFRVPRCVADSGDVIDRRGATPPGFDLDEGGGYEPFPPPDSYVSVDEATAAVARERRSGNRDLAVIGVCAFAAGWLVSGAIHGSAAGRVAPGVRSRRQR